MLAIQRPSMGSSKPPNLDMPFGYSFDPSTSNFPFPSPTAPAPGPSLLDDNESKFLDSFFDGVSSDHFNYDFFTNATDGSELGLGWEELPPTFMGTTSSFGQQPPQIASLGLPDMGFNAINGQVNVVPAAATTTSADVLAAATLLQNGSNGQSHSMGTEALFAGQGMPMVQTNGQIRPQSMTQYATPRANLTVQSRSRGDDYMRDLPTDLVSVWHSAAAEGLPRPKPATKKVDIRWGSDVGFGSTQSFVPPTSQEKLAAAEREQLSYMEGFIEAIKEPSSAGNTRPSSPRPFMPHQNSKSGARSNDDNNQDPRPRKRRKGKFQDSADDDEDSTVSATLKQSGLQKRKSINTASPNGSPEPSSEYSHKRRKSASAAATAAAKASRENLTEDQKRENHIKSEQKRRTLIREGFEDLGELVPGLRGGGFSKSAVLLMAADWLEELIQGNAVLKEKIDSMQGRG